MVANYFTLFHIARLLGKNLHGWRFNSLFSQQKRELVASVVSGLADGSSRENFLVISCEPSQNFLYLIDDFRRAKKNSVDLFESIGGRSITAVSVLASDRSIVFSLDDEKQFVVQLFGSKANVVLVNDRGIIEEAFLRGKEIVGQSLVERLPFVFPTNVDEFSQALLSSPEAPLEQRLKKIFPHWGSLLVRELLFRAFGPEAPSSEVSRADAARLHDETTSLLAELRDHPSPQILYQGTTPRVFSIITLKHFESDRVELFDSIFGGIRAFLGSSRRSDRFVSDKEVLEKALRKDLDHTSRTLKKMEEEAQSLERAELYELSGKLLMANIHLVSKGMKSVQLENVYTPSEGPVSVQLDPNLTPAKNAERYFEKSRKARKSIEEQKGRKKEAEERQRLVQQLVDEIEGIETAEELRDFVNGRHDQLKNVGIKVSKSGVASKEETIPFRVFTVAGGFQVWAGKSGENNDLLSTRFTKQNDLWFHARAVGGSHVVLKMGTGKGEVSKHAMEQAAAIAAYYSKMKGAKLVPVSMCEGKYVRKPKGAPPGSVRIEREKTLLVEPRLPDG
ncbi:MAG: NFACT family protein [Bacteroidota bacterium]